MVVDLLTSEYESLRTEAIENRKTQIQIAFASPSLIVGLLGLLFSTGNNIPNEVLAWLFLVPVPLLFFNLMLIFERARSSIRIVAYIEYFLECANPSTGWESRLEKWRSSTNSKKSFFRNLKLIIMAIFRRLMDFSFLQIPKMLLKSRERDFINYRYLTWNFYTITILIHTFLASALLLASVTKGVDLLTKSLEYKLGFSFLILFTLNMAISFTWDTYTMYEFKQKTRKKWKLIKADE